MAAAATTKTARDGASTPAQFPLGFLDLSGTGGGPFVPLHALYDSTGALINPATKEGVAAIATALAGTLAISAQALPLPAGAATDTSLGTDGASAPVIAGTGIRGWLRAIYEKVAGTLTVGGSVSVSNLPATQAVSAASLPLPSGAATSAAQGASNTSLASIDTKTPALASGRVPVDGSGVTQPVSAASLPLPAGAATSAAQTTGNTSLSSIDGKVPAKGQAAMAGSTPVAIATDQTAVPISAAALPLPAGAATSAKQDAAMAAVAATGPGTDAFAVTPNDTNNFTTNARSLYVGVTGDVVVVTPANSVVTFKAVPAGAILPVQAKRVNATNTTATSIVGLI